ncbi:MAG: DNA recombination protein RmuC [Alphaproteobacteria bacterium]|nr:DNA recombination protein RmuC [Alphaproteobacteria bacterium]
MELLLVGLGCWLVGGALGFAAAWWLGQQRVAALQGAEAQLKQAFTALAAEALQANSAQLIEHTKAQLAVQQKEGEGVLAQRSQQVAATLGQLKDQLTEKLGQVQGRLETLEKERAQQYQVLDTRLTEASKVIGSLQQTTGSLKEALTNSRVRGQWGERMAADVLRLAGLQEGLSYIAQHQLDDGSKPDFTFPLPSGRVLHMDVKFPLDGYLNYLNATDEAARAAALKSFVQATRGHLKTTGTRSYRHDANGLDYVLVFIPNEQVYATLFEHDPELLDYALNQKIILCSPTTLLAVLALIRQAEQSFKLEAQFAALAADLAGFKSQWEKFIDAHDDVKKAFDRVGKTFDDLLGVRTRQLEKAVEKLLPGGGMAQAQPQPVAGAVPPRLELN